MGDWSRLAVNSSDKRRRRSSESNANPFQCQPAPTNSQASYPTRAGDFLVGTTVNTQPTNAKVIIDTTNIDATVVNTKSNTVDDDSNNKNLDQNSSETSPPRQQLHQRSNHGIIRNESFSALLGVLNQPELQPQAKRKRYTKPQADVLSADLQSDFDFDLDDVGVDMKVKGIPNENDVETTTTNTEIPMDWSIKHHVRFTSEASFDWTKRMKGTDKAHGLTNFVRSNHRTSFKDDLPDENLSSTFHNAGLYYVHPGQPWARAFRDKMSLYIDESRADAEELAYLDLVNSEWTAAFTSAYQSLQNNLCPYLYVSSKEFVVLFRARGIGGTDEVSAIISRSSRGLRASLEREAVPFDIPLVPEYAAQRLGRAQAEAQLARLEEDESGPYKLQTKISSELSSSRHDGSYKSLLTFKGHDGVHALFEYLLNRKYARQSSIRLLEPPTLYSCAEFLNCTLKSMKVKFCGTISRKKKINGRSNMSETYHCLELEGVCLPHSFIKLYNTFNVSQDKTFEVVVLKNNPSTGALNYNSDDIETPPNLETDDISEFYKASTLGTSCFSKITVDNGEPLFTSKQAQ